MSSFRLFSKQERRKVEGMVKGQERFSVSTVPKFGHRISAFGLEMNQTPSHLTETHCLSLKASESISRDNSCRKYLPFCKSAIVRASAESLSTWRHPPLI